MNLSVYLVNISNHREYKLGIIPSFQVMDAFIEKNTNKANYSITSIK